ncbi:hypothetical protein E5083_30245 [Streptomyces bauhiniae]|uniref:Uncharacterized protein n=1 Tax=Streptomyces bauhiniae TaxID=2340725 RepID=A0A4Z1CTQ6_9ACTN|nr:hypothetical protein [Streptomyces bauhiniae]TGN72220.1 hypothetical protein E5083_30245 [Streptomyces bauhiniae]
MNQPVRTDAQPVYTITQHHPAASIAVTQGAAPPAPSPPPGAGVELVVLPGGEQRWAYVPATRPAPYGGPRSQPVPAWAKTAALLMWSAAGSAAVAGWGLSLAGPWLEALAWALVAFAVAVSVVAYVVRGLFARARRAGGGNRAEATATATGRTVLGGKVTATATAVAHSE